jgi:site-specific recombinase XerD
MQSDLGVQTDGAISRRRYSAWLGGPQSSPKGLWHGFGVAAVSAGISLNLAQKWLGHAQLTTTAIYPDAVGAEEKDIARWMWV